MSVKPLLFLLWYSLLYLGLNISWVMTPVTFLQYQRGIYWNIRDYFLWMLIAFIPYYGMVLYQRNRKTMTIILVIAGIIAVHILRMGLVYHFKLDITSYYLKNPHLVFPIPFFGFAFFFIRHSHYHALQEKEIVAQNRNSELSFLRMQVNPHFLFNSLNNVYGLVFERSPKAAGVMKSLSQMMRYLYLNTNNDINLSEELTYIREYIAIQKLRYEPEITVSFSQKGDMDLIRIPPFLLLPIIENAFKHGNFSKGGELVIRISTDGAGLTTFSCENPLGSPENNNLEGVGIRNLERRLELIYHNRHDLFISRSDGKYKIDITLIHG